MGKRSGRLPVEDRSFTMNSVRGFAGGRCRWSTESGANVGCPGIYRDNTCLNRDGSIDGDIVFGPASPPLGFFLSDQGFFHYGEDLKMELSGPGPTLIGVGVTPGGPDFVTPSVEAVYKGMHADKVGKGPGAYSADSYPDGHISLDMRRYGHPLVLLGISLCGADSKGRLVGNDAWTTGLTHESWSLKVMNMGKTLNGSNGGIRHTIEPHCVLDLYFSAGQGIHAICDLPMLVVDLHFAKGGSLRLGMRTEEGAGVRFPSAIFSYVGMTEDRTGAVAAKPMPDGQPDGEFRLSPFRR